MYQHFPSPVKFRKDINGLRAWAVLAVLFFHFSFIGLSGGFAGVDVFFVISGYLMTAIVIDGHEKGDFSICKFYMARARRILPALLVTIAVLLVLGWFWLPTPDYQALGAQSAYGLTFLSNIYYWRSAGYFDSAAEEKWLLHTWSLAVEVQFYLVYPIFISLIWKYWKSIKSITVGVMTLLITSLALNLWVTTWDPSGAFYLLPTRAWELAAGAIVYLVIKQRLVSESFKSNGYWFGWILVIASFFFITEHFAWPSYWAILPVLGTSLIILAERENYILTDNFFAQWIGNRSYSLYLLHWPLVVALNFASLQNEWILGMGVFVLSILFAHLSFKFVETPTRQYLSQAKLFKEILIITSVIMVLGFCSVSIKLFSIENRINNDIDHIALEKNNENVRKKECFDSSSHTLKSKGCIYGSSKLGVVMVGDSHAGSTISALSEAASRYDLSAMLLGQSSCPFIDGIKFKYNNLRCFKFNNYLLEEQLPKISKGIPVVLMSRFNSYTVGTLGSENINSYFSEPLKNGVNDENYKIYISELKKAFVSSVCKLNQTNPVYLVRPTPEMDVDVPSYLSRKMVFGQDISTISIPVSEHLLRSSLAYEIQDIAAKQCNVKILDPIQYLCDENNCYGVLKGRPIYVDEDHLSEYGNKFLVPMFEKIFMNLN